MVGSLSPERMRRVLGPKAAGAWHLHELTAGDELSAFVLFSSVAGVFGNPGQASYAAANAFVDALAACRTAGGLPGLALGWGIWDQGEDTDGAGMSWLHRNAEVLAKRADEEGSLWVTVRADAAKVAQIRNKFRAASNR